MSSLHTQKVRLLYKTILKLHRGLPTELQILGTKYMRDEFRRHKKCSSEQAQIFMREWTDYALILAKQLGLRGPNTGKKLGVPVNKEDIDSMKDEQIVQLYELMKEATQKD